MEITKDGGILQFGKPEWGSGKFAENGEWLDIRAEKKVADGIKISFRPPRPQDSQKIKVA